MRFPSAAPHSPPSLVVESQHVVNAVNAEERVDGVPAGWLSAC